MAAGLDSNYLERILAAVREVSACEDAIAFREALASSVQALMPGDLYHVMDADLQTGEIEVLMTPAEAAVPHEVAFAVLDHFHPVAHHYLETGDGSAIRLSDVSSAEDYHDLPIYKEHYKDHGVEYQLGSTIPCPENRVLSIGLNREHEDFDDNEVLALDRLRPHLVQGARNVEVRSQLERLVAGSPAAGEDGDSVHGVALVDRGRVVEADASIVQALRDTFGASGSASTLPDDVDDWVRTEHRRLDRLESAEGIRLHEPMVARPGSGRVALRYVPGSDQGAVVVDKRSWDDAQRLSGYGLTERECNVLAVLAGGATNTEIADKLAISPHTVRKHLERVYRKLGVNSRTSAVSLAYEVLGADRR